MPATTSTALPPLRQKMRSEYQVAFFHVVVHAFYQWLRLIGLVVFCHLSGDCKGETRGCAKGSENTGFAQIRSLGLQAD